MNDKLYDQFRYFEAKEDLDGQKSVLKRLLNREPDHHLWLTILSSVYYELRDYKTALKYSIQALKIEPHCPLVLWDYAGALDMLGREKEAIKIWKRLLARGEENIAYGVCGEGLRWSRSLLNDCRYRIAVAYLRLGKEKLASRYFSAHLENRKRGLYSLYSKKELLKRMAMIHSNA